MSNLAKLASLFVGCLVVLGCGSLSELIIRNDLQDSVDFRAQSELGDEKKKAAGSLAAGEEMDLCRFYVFGPSRIDLLTVHKGLDKRYKLSSDELPDYLIRTSSGGSTIVLHVTDQGVEFEQRVESNFDVWLRGWMVAAFVAPATILFVLLFLGWRRQRRG